MAADRWQVDIGVQSRYYDSAPTAALAYQAEDLTPLGSATVAFDGGASGGSRVQVTDVGPVWRAMLKSEIAATNAALTHKGSFRLKARILKASASGVQKWMRLEWAEGDYSRRTLNDPVTWGDQSGSAYTWVDLGVVHISPKAARWEFRILVQASQSNSLFAVDCVALLPTKEGYAELSAIQRFETPSVFSARDEFDQAAGALTGKSAPVGGTWAGAGDADDFAVETTGLTAQRTAVSDSSLTTGRYAVSGVAAFGAQAVQVDFKLGAVALGSGGCFYGVLARYVDTNNWAFAGFNWNGQQWQRQVRHMEAGTNRLLWNLGAGPNGLAAGTWYTSRFIIHATGHWVWWFGERGGTMAVAAAGFRSAFGAGGSLTTGKPGFYDAHAVAAASTRNYDNFFAFAPTRDAAVFAGRSLELRHDGARREDASGTFWAPVSECRGSYLRIPPSGLEGRSTRIIVLPHENEPETMPDPTAPANIQAQLFVTPRGLVVPGA